MKDMDLTRRGLKTAYEEVKRLKGEIKEAGEDKEYKSYLDWALKHAKYQVKIYALELINQIETGSPYIFSNNPKYNLRNELRNLSIEADKESITALNKYMMI